MKRIDLIRHLERHGVQFLREGGSLARIIHEGFYCNRRYAVPTGSSLADSMDCWNSF